MTIDDMIRIKKERGLTYEMISRSSGVPLGTVQKVLGGKTLSPRYDTILALERALEEYDSPIPFVMEGRDYKATSKASGSRSKRSRNDYQDDIEGTSARKRTKGEYNILIDDSVTKVYRSRFSIREGSKTIDDYMALPDDMRVELIDGRFYDMASPSVIHQNIILLIAIKLREFIKANRGGCKVHIAPLDVKLCDNNKTMVQPDIFVVCDKSKISDTRINGAPDLIIEVVSPSNWHVDVIIKKRKYKEAGVREYWIIHPENQTVIAYDFVENAEYMYTFEDTIPVLIWDGRCVIDFSDIYEEAVE